jgi:hypothetical protein
MQAGTFTANQSTNTTINIAAPTWDEVTEKPTSFYPSAHSHPEYASTTDRVNNDITAASLTTSLLTLIRAAGNLTASVPTWNQSTTGNAGSATKLATARTIGGVSFDGTANINLPGVNAAGNQDTTGTAANATSLTGNVSVTLGSTESTAKFGTAAIAQTLATWLMQIGQRINGIIQALSSKANDADVVKLTGNQTIAGTKTFSTSPVVPSKTTAAMNDGTLVATEAQVYLKQDKLTATGTSNLLVAPSASGGQPTGKPISDFILSPSAAMANQRLLLAPAIKGNPPDLLLAPTAAGQVPTWNGSNIIWQKPNTGITKLEAHLIINGYPVWLFLDDLNTDLYGSWMPYEPGTYLICAMGGGGEGGTSSSSNTYWYVGGEGGAGGLAVSQYTVTQQDINSFDPIQRKYLQWRTTTGGVVYAYIADSTQPQYVRIMQANKGSNGGSTTSSSTGSGGAGGTATGGNLVNLQGAGGLGGYRTTSSNVYYGSNGAGSAQSGTYAQYFDVRFPNAANVTSPRFTGRYFCHAATGVSVLHLGLTKNINGGNHTLRYTGGLGCGGGGSDGQGGTEYRGWGGPGGVVIIKTA